MDREEGTNEFEVYYACWTFELLHRESDGLRAIHCRQCDMTSYNPNDVDRRYCGACHEFLEEPKKV